MLQAAVEYASVSTHCIFLAFRTTDSLSDMPPENNFALVCYAVFFD